MLRIYLLNRIEFTNCKGNIEDNKLIISGKESEKDMKIIIPDVNITNEEVCIVIITKCKALTDQAPDVARIIIVRSIDKDSNSILI